MLCDQPFTREDLSGRLGGFRAKHFTIDVDGDGKDTYYNYDGASSSPQATTPTTATTIVLPGASGSARATADDIRVADIPLPSWRIQLSLPDGGIELVDIPNDVPVRGLPSAKVDYVPAAGITHMIGGLNKLFFEKMLSAHEAIMKAMIKAKTSMKKSEFSKMPTHV